MAEVTEEQIQAIIGLRDDVAQLVSNIRDRDGRVIPIYQHRDEDGDRGDRTGPPYITVDLVRMELIEYVGKWRGVVRVKIYSRATGADVRHDGVRAWAALWASSQHTLDEEITFGAVDDYRASDVDGRGAVAVATEIMVRPAY